MEWLYPILFISAFGVGYVLLNAFLERPLTGTMKKKKR